MAEIKAPFFQNRLPMAQSLNGMSLKANKLTVMTY